MTTAVAHERARARKLDEMVSRARRAVEQALPPADTPPRIIHEAMRYSALAPGKALRPVLVMASAECVGGPGVLDGAVETAAAAVELVHTYSLIHDDLPAMDDDDVRRGQPANHIVYGEAIAILAGDALLTRAFEILSGLSRYGVGSDQVVAVIGELAAAAGTAGLIGGQVDDLGANDEPTDLERLRSIHARKTGALFRASMRIGGRLGGASDSELALLGDFGADLGEAFQIVDDILDIAGDEASLGKPVGSDARRGRVTVPALIGLEGAWRLADETVHRALRHLDPLGPRANFLRWLALKLMRRRR